jgi:hypothetical protein
MQPTKLRRRSLLQALASATAVAGLPQLMRAAPARAQAIPADRKFLFVMAAAGGGSIIDSFAPIVQSESTLGATLVTYPGNFVSTVGNLRCVHSAFPLQVLGSAVNGHLLPFLQQHGEDTAVLMQESTSVNHIIAQKRAMTGNNINAGRTILEAAAQRHGTDLLLPAVNMCESGYLEPGDDPTLPDHARAVAVADALRFPFATDGRRGLGQTPNDVLLARARRIRDGIDDASNFGVTFRDAPMRQVYRDQRRLTSSLEDADLITKLMMVRDIPGALPLNDYNLSSSEDEPLVRAQFPGLFDDPLQAQAALAFLLVKSGVSCAVSMSPSFNPLLGNNPNTPLAFDFSHTNHTFSQYAMWSRILRVTDGLIRLLKATNVNDDPAQGTLWSRSVVYIATDFGRDKTRPANSFEFGTGHNLNNGNIVVSPLVRGNRIYGGVDPETALTYGFDRTTGDPVPGSNMHEGDVYSAVAHALDINFDGRLNMPAIVRAG